MRAIIAGSIGNLIEWYDFYVYAFMSLYFSSQFFPNSDPIVQIMATSGVFAVGFFMRPIGGWYFGRLADRSGRQLAMVVSVLLMGAGSLLIGIVPVYDQIGMLAPLLLLIGRMVQGFSTGGQYGTAATYLSEIAGSSRRGYYASFQYVTLIGGQLLATLLLVLLQQLLTEDAMRSYGWRIAFLLGAVSSVGILVLRRYMPETFEEHGRDAESGSLRALFKHWRALLIVCGLTAGGSLSFYTFTTYMQKYLVLTTGFSKEIATSVMTAVLIPYMLMQPLFGALSDRIGRRNNLIAFGALSCVLTIPLLYGLASAPTPFVAALLILAGLAVTALYTSVSGLFKAELFPIHVRAMGVGLSYGVANALFGGTAENVALAFKDAGVESGFYWYVTLISLVTLVTAVMMRDLKKHGTIQEQGGGGPVPEEPRGGETNNMRRVDG